MAGLIVTIGAVAIGFMDPPQVFGMLYLRLGMHAVFCAATALLVASLSEMSDLVEKSIQVFALSRFSCRTRSR